MEIVYVIEDFSIKGGAERIIAEKANYLASRFQHHVTIVSIYHDERPISYHLEESVDFISLEIPFTPKNNSILLKTLFRIITIGKIIFKFQTIINRIQPKLIFYTMSLGAILLPLIKTKAKKSVANFKLREGMAIGCKTTLRGDKMYEFADRLINLALPRVRDFRGVSANSFDGRGNYALGIKEQLIFPEIEYDKVDKVRGMDVIFVTTANTDEEARELIRLFGMPYVK